MTNLTSHHSPLSVGGGGYKKSNLGPNSGSFIQMFKTSERATDFHEPKSCSIQAFKLLFASPSFLREKPLGKEKKRTIFVMPKGQKNLKLKMVVTQSKRCCHIFLRSRGNCNIYTAVLGTPRYLSIIQSTKPLVTCLWYSHFNLS